MLAKVNSTETLHEGRVFRVVRENVTLPNGVSIDLDIVRHPGASAVVPLLDGETIVLLKQYRHAIRDFIWEIPAGTLAQNECPLDCAKRELTEETGFAAGSWRKLGEVTPVPGYSDERIHIFLAKDLTRAEQKLDSDEILHVQKIKFADAVNMIHQGTIRDSKTICGLLMATHEADLAS
jgi:8-oxo-dGTP pyrophosphatase MutT (NUDIX family)